MQNTVSKSTPTNKFRTVLILLKKRPIFSILISFIGFFFLLILVRNTLIIWATEQIMWQKYQRSVSIQALDVRFISPTELTLSIQGFVLTEPNKNLSFAQFKSLYTMFSFDLSHEVIKINTFQLDQPQINLWQNGKKDNFSDLLKSDGTPSHWQVLPHHLYVNALNLTYTRPDQFRKPLVLSGQTELKTINNQWHIGFKGRVDPLTPLQLNAIYQQGEVTLRVHTLDISRFPAIQIESANSTKKADGIDFSQLKTQLQTLPITGKVSIDTLKITSDMIVTNLAVDLNKNK